MTQRGDIYDRQLGEFIPITGFQKLSPAARYWISPKRDGARSNKMNVTFEPDPGKCPEHLLNVFDPTVIVKKSSDDGSWPQLFYSLSLQN